MGAFNAVATHGGPPMSDYVGLLPHHADLLRASAISPEVVAARGYRSMTNPLLEFGESPADAVVRELNAWRESAGPL